MNTPVVFLTLVRSAKEESLARVMIDSLRTFGGTLRECPIWIFATDLQNAFGMNLRPDNVKVFSFNVPANIRRYNFADKVYACAQAEAMAKTNVQSLVWVDPNCLVVNPPLLFDLGPEFDAAVRPVHIRNVGVLASDPLDDYWRTIYQAVGVAEVAETVESFVDRQHIRAYFNSHAFSINPSAGLMHQWLASFEKLVCDSAFQARACADELHQTFLFQAVWSALLVKSFQPQRIRILPPTYNYPYHLHARVPTEIRPRSLNALVCFVYEDRIVDPDKMTDIKVREPLRAWLAVHR